MKKYKRGPEIHKKKDEKERRQLTGFMEPDQADSHTHYYVGLIKREEREKGAKSLFIEMTGNVHSKEEETDFQIQEAESNHQ